MEMKIIGKVLEKISLFFAGVSFAAVAFMMVLISIDVLIRWISNGSVKGTYELTEVAMGMGVFGAFAFAQVKHSHVHVTLLLQYYPRRIRFFSYALTGLVTTVAIFAVSYASLVQSQASMAQNQMTSVLHVPMYPFYIWEGLSCFVFGLVLLYDTIRCFMAIFNKDLAEEIQATWS